VKYQTQASPAQAKPVGAWRVAEMPAPRIPLGLKVSVTAFLAILLPVYWHTYGLTNFLWFCDAALIVTTVGLWQESSLLISICAVGILVPQCLWLADCAVNLLGGHFLALTSYMFDPRLSRFTRGLSLFHGWLPILLVWLLFRLGYDERALWGWTGLAAGLMLAGYWLGLPAGAHPADPNVPVNLNYVYGFNDQHPQTWVSQNLYIVLWLGALWFVAWFPTHLLLSKVFAVAPPAAARKPSIRIF
jgi:hypothetical protein